MVRKKLTEDGLNVGSWIRNNSIARFFKRKIIDRIKSYNSNYELNMVYKKYFINSQDKKNAIILASSPKSGNTWVRFIFANIVALQELNGEIVDFHKLERYFPEEDREDDMIKPWNFKTVPCIVKTHKPHKKIYDNFKKFFVYRNPLDTMVSQYYYIITRVADPVTKTDAKTEEDIRIRTEEWKRRGPGRYIRHSLGIERWCHHFNSWINNCDVHISYEQLKYNPKKAFREILDVLSLDIKDDILEEAIRRSDFKNVQTLEEKSGKSPRMAQLSTKFARKGNIGQWKDYFNKEDIAYFKSKMAQWGIDILRFEHGAPLDL